MIIENGYIKAMEVKGGEINPETGFPTKVTSDWGDAIPCQFKANKYNGRGRVNGEAFTIAQYEILIEDQPIDTTLISLYNHSEKLIGEFAVVEIEPLDGVCQKRITV